LAWASLRCPADRMKSANQVRSALGLTSKRGAKICRGVEAEPGVWFWPRLVSAHLPRYSPDLSVLAFMAVRDRSLNPLVRPLPPLALQSLGCFSSSFFSEPCEVLTPPFLDRFRPVTMAEVKIEMPQDEVDAIIRNKRKARDPKGLLLRHEPNSSIC
jgi:hypothetical protein